MKILIIGGSGFLSGALARLAVETRHAVWTLTRGQRELPAGVIPLIADRRDGAAFARAVAEASTEWDLVVDCIGYEPSDVQQDVAVLRDRAGRLVFVSTDFVYDPARRTVPQGEESDHWLAGGYGGKKRQCEVQLADAGAGDMEWTVVRPCHIYGPGSLLGCLPLHGRDPRLIERLRAGEALKLVGGGHFLQQPIHARDLSETILSMAGRDSCRGQIFCVAGPDIIESRVYYRIIADVLGVDLRVEELPVSAHLAAHPEAAPFLCHRVYDLSKLRTSGAAMPSTPVEVGLAEHVASLLR